VKGETKATPASAVFLFSVFFEEEKQQEEHFATN